MASTRWVRSGFNAYNTCPRLGDGRRDVDEPASWTRAQRQTPPSPADHAGKRAAPSAFGAAEPGSCWRPASCGRGEMAAGPWRNAPCCTQHSLPSSLRGSSAVRSSRGVGVWRCIAHLSATRYARLRTTENMDSGSAATPPPPPPPPLRTEAFCRTVLTLITPGRPPLCPGTRARLCHLYGRQGRISLQCARR